MQEMPRPVTRYAAVLVALGLAGCGGGGPSPTQRTVTLTVPPPVSSPAVSVPAPDPKPPVPVPDPKPAVLTLPKQSFPVVYVKRKRVVEIHTEPGGQVVRRVRSHTPFGSRTTMAVARTSGRWAAVITPFLPNNQLGWVRLDPKRLGAYGSNYSIDVDLSQRQASILRKGHVVRSFSVTVGAAASPTPTGHFALTDTFRGNLNPAYGCCAAALSANQPTLPSGWFGGSRIAIHGTYEALGEALSHGCIRAADADVSAIVSTVPIGSPVNVHL
jgi:lipoprotein-anchoring transpeptidase ErfK/SrfK